MVTLITGAAGFIGFHLINRLLKRGEKIIGIDNLSPYYDVNLKKSRLNILKENKNFFYKNVDISDFESLKSCFKEDKITLVCHLAAQAGVRYALENPAEYVNTNLVGHFNILENCKIFGVKNLLYASSSSVYGGNTKIPFSEKDNVDNPVSLYAATKRSDELLSSTYSNLYKINTIGLRFFTVYGPWGRPDMATWIFTERILNNQPIKVFNKGNMYRDFTYIDDIIEGTMSIYDFLSNTTNKVISDVYNIGNNSPVNLLDFINIIESSLGKTATKTMLPMQLGDVEKTYADITKIQTDFNFKPSTSIKRGVPKFLEWYKKYHKL